MNTIFGFAAYSFLALSSLSTWSVLLIAGIAAISFNFCTAGGIVFRDLNIKRAPKFLIIYGIVFLIYLTLIEWLSPIVGGRIFAMAIIVLPVATLNYVLQTAFVFSRRPD